MALVLLSSAAANGAGPIVEDTRLDSLRRAPLTLYVSGTFNGATVTIQASADGQTFLSVPNAAFTAPSVANLDVTAVAIQAVVTNAAAGTSITVTGL